jgi:tol-pal system protein YbgF
MRGRAITVFSPSQDARAVRFLIFCFAFMQEGFLAGENYAKTEAYANRLGGTPTAKGGSGMTFRAVGCAVLMLAAAGLPLDASAQDRRTDRRIAELERQLQDLQGAVYGSDPSGSPVRFQGANPEGRPAAASQAVEPAATAALNVRLGALEQEMQRLTGEIERLTFQMNQQQDQMKRLVAMAYPEYEGDIGLSLQNQRDVVASGGTVNTQPTPGGGPVDLVGGGSAGDALPTYADAETAYAAGRSAHLEARYADAERAFLALTEAFPDSDRAGDASYYLGETYLAQGDVGASARTFLDFIRNHGDNPRAAEAHLKLGQAFARADKTNEACRVWQRGLQTYPQMDGSLRDRITDMREATCA